ncbi:MAG TPA: hypothetical protein VHO66_07965 [Ruminiclostridium sp.]|nr:hypothetical protein [Ruminiclostridium sp.]
MVQIKVFSAMTERGLENKVNSFIANQFIEMKEMQFQASFGQIYCMITYETKTQKSNLPNSTELI